MDFMNASTRARESAPSRIFALQGGCNFRDIGGYQTADGRQVRWGRVYRTGVLSYFTDGDRDVLKPLGVGVVCEAYHLCMMMRGVEKQNSKTITSAMRGTFLEDPRTREEFLRLSMVQSIMG